MNYKNEPDASFQNFPIEFQIEETTYFSDTNSNKIPININFFLDQFDNCYQNSDYDAFSSVINNFTEILRDTNYFLPNEYIASSVSKRVLNFLNPVEHPELLCSIIPFIEKWTSYQDVENDDFVFPDFFYYIMSVIESKELDPNYERIDTYHPLFYEILNNLLITSKNMRENFINEDPISTFKDIYSVDNYYLISYDKNKMNESIISIIVNSLRDYGFENQLPKSFSNSLMGFYEICKYRFDYCFLDTTKYEFDFLQVFIQTNEEQMKFFFSHFKILEYLKNWNQLTNERFFPFLRILKSIFQNTNYYSDEYINFIKTDILGQIKIGYIIEYFRKHEENEESLQYIKFLNIYFLVCHDGLNVIMGSKPIDDTINKLTDGTNKNPNYMNEFIRFEKFISDGSYQLRVETLKLFNLIFDINSDYIIDKVLQELQDFKIRSRIGPDFIDMILDLIGYEDTKLNIKILNIFIRVLTNCYNHDTLIAFGLKKIEEREINKSIDDMKYEDGQIPEIIELCDIILDQIRCISAKSENIQLQKEADQKRREEEFNEDPFKDLFILAEKERQDEEEDFYYISDDSD